MRIAVRPAAVLVAMDWMVTWPNKAASLNPGKSISNKAATILLYSAHDDAGASARASASNSSIRSR